MSMEPEVRLPPADKAKEIKKAKEQLRRQMIYSQGGIVQECPSCELREMFYASDYICFLCREELDG